MNPLLTMHAIVTDAFGGRGGIAQYNRDFLGALADARIMSSITVLPRQAPDLPAPPETIEQMPARPGRIAYSVAGLRAALFQPVDLVFCGHLFMAPLAALIARLKAAMLIVQTHGIEAWPRPSRLQRAALESADLVLCVSRYTRAAVLSWAAIAPERVLVVPNTVKEMFTPGDGSTTRAALAVGSKRVLLTVGRMDSGQRYKGQDRVIAAIPYIVAQGPRRNSRFRLCRWTADRTVAESHSGRAAYRGNRMTRSQQKRSEAHCDRKPHAYALGQ